MTTEPEMQADPHGTAPRTWRDLVQSGADGAQIEGLALEYLIDLQRGRRHTTGEAR